MITEPKLPPKSGCVEVERGGVRVYRDAIIDSEPPPSAQEQQRADIDYLAAMTGVQL